jgi:hypothetical protein
VLDETYHAALLRNVTAVLREANIPAAALHRSMAGTCSEEEISYVKKLRGHPRHGVYGLVMLGRHPTTSPLERCHAIAAACVRNYIGARVMTMQDILDALDEKDMPQPTVLLIPNFYVGQDAGRISHWDIPSLLGLLYARQSASLQTVVYVKDMAQLGKAYGDSFVQHLNSERFYKSDTNEAVE